MSAATPIQYGAAAEESAASSSPSSPEPALDDDADSIMLQHSNESQSSLGAPSSRSSSAAPNNRRVRPKPAIENVPPEILIMILQKLSSPHDLYHCVLVCKKWARCAIDLLWHRPLFTDWKKLTQVAQAIQEPNATWSYAEMVRRLNLSNLSTINDGTLQPFSSCKRIERLTLTGCSNLTDHGIISLVEGNRNLLALDITGIHFITDQTIQALAKNCTKLQGLNITACNNVSDASMVPFAHACTHLKRLKLNKCTNLTDASIEAFAQYCSAMLEIDLQGCDLVTDSSIIALLQGGRNLRELRLAMCQKVTNMAFLSLPPSLKLEPLRILDLTACSQLTDAAVEKIIDSAPRLRILVLAKCNELTDRSVYAISKLGKNLHDIHLGRCVQITDDALKELVTKCNRIRYIDLAGCTGVTDHSVKLLANLPKLRRIGLVKCQSITDLSIFALACGNGGFASTHTRSQLSSSLERVHLSYCVNITLEGVNRLLQKCPKLTHLSLTGIHAFFSRTDLTDFCREAPLEFNEEQRQVFCVFSGEGVQQLRSHLARDPTAYPAEEMNMYPSGHDSDEVAIGGVNVETAPPYHHPPSALQYEPHVAHYHDRVPSHPNVPTVHHHHHPSHQLDRQAPQHAHHTMPGADYATLPAGAWNGSLPMQYTNVNVPHSQAAYMQHSQHPNARQQLLADSTPIPPYHSHQYPHLRRSQQFEQAYRMQQPLPQQQQQQQQYPRPIGAPYAGTGGSSQAQHNRHTNPPPDLPEDFED